MLSMIEAKDDFSQGEVEEFTGHATVGIEPLFGVAPEALDAVDVVASLGPALLLFDYDVQFR